MNIQHVAGPFRTVSTVSLIMLATSLWGCAPDATSPQPELTASFSKPVSSTSNPANFTFPASGYVVTSDGGGVYSNGVCNVTAKVFIDTDLTEDANLQTSGGKNCTRRVLITYSDVVGVVDQVTGLNVNDVGTVTTTGDRTMNFTIASPKRCSRVGFGNVVNPSGALVHVTRGADVGGKRGWNVSFNGLGTCVTLSGALADVPMTLNFDVSEQ